MKTPVEVDLAILRTLFESAISRVETNFGSKVELPWDYYWDLDPQEVFEIEKQPSEPGLGQLSDDWGSLQQIFEGETPPLGYALTWIAAILRAVGQRAPN